MRILIVLPWDNIGGVADVTRNLAQYLERRGHKILFAFRGKSVFPQKKITRFGFPSVQFRMQAPLGQRHPLLSIPVFLLLFPVTLFQVIRLIRQYRIDVINVHFPEECFLYFALYSRIFGTGLISSIHGAEVFRGGSLSSKIPGALKLILRWSNLIIAPSKRCRDDFVTLFPNFIAKTIFIHNGVDLSRFQNTSREKPESYCLPYVLTVSACKKQKALDVLIHAFKPVHDAFPLLDLVVVGDGPLRGELEDLAAALGLTERVKFLGYKTPAEVIRLLSNCEIFVLPSRFETFGIAILEAMACGRPVIGTTAGGIPEIIENGENGILVEPDNPPVLAEAILSVLRDLKLQRTISKNGRAAVEQRFCSDYSGKAYETLFFTLGQRAIKLESQAARR
jgi:glycosyltransferase involved in cell wall biosynthesis